MICKTCGLDKDSADDFHQRVARDGSLEPRKECKACRNLRAKNYVASFSPERHAQYRRNMTARQKRFAERNPFYWMAKQLRHRAKRKGFAVLGVDSAHLSKLWNAQKGLCALTGLPMTFPVERRGFDRALNRVSVDRIDSALGYIIGNIQLVRAGVNISKNSHSNAAFVAMCCAVADHSRRAREATA